MARFKLFVLGSSVALAIFASILIFHATRANAQGPKRGNPLQRLALSEVIRPSVSKDADSKVVPLPPMDPVARINRIIDQKEQLLAATNASIDERLEVNAECQQNIDDLVAGVSNVGSTDLGEHIRDTKPKIRNLKHVIAKNLSSIAWSAVLADNLNRRIVQLKFQLAYELQPDPSRLLWLKKQLHTKVNQILSGIDSMDPRPGLELNRIAALHKKMEPLIEAEEADFLNREADATVAAEAWEDSAYDRYLLLQATDLPAQLRDDLINSPKM